MCLKTVDLNLTWNNRVKDYVGWGYKVYSLELFNYDSNGNTYKANIPNNGKFNTWLEAIGNKGDQSLNTLSKNKINSTNYEPYHPGFHIFLDEQDAVDYWHLNGIQRVLCEVAYTNVLSFGTNESKEYSYKPCVVARYMEIYPKYIIKNNIKYNIEFTNKSKQIFKFGNVIQ